MRNRAVFTEVETLRGRAKEPGVSALALEMHVRAVARAVRTATPAFISDTGLDAIAPGRVTTMAAIELCLAGLWHRTYGGYAIADAELIGHMTVPSSIRRIKAAFRRLWRELNSERVIPL